MKPSGNPAPWGLPVLLITLLAGAGCVAPGSSADSEAALAVLETQKELWNDGRLEAFVEEGYWKSKELNFLSRGDWRRGYDDLLERYQITYGDGSAGMGRLSFTDTEAIPLSSRHVLVRGRWHLDFDEADGGGSQGGLFTLIMTKKADGWRIVHDHTSVAQEVEEL